MKNFYIYQTNPVTRTRLAFGPFTEREVTAVRPHCGGKWVKVVKTDKPKYPCYDNGDLLRSMVKT